MHSSRKEKINNFFLEPTNGLWPPQLHKMRLFCATFAPARKWRKSYTLRCHCVTFALSSNFFEKKSTQKCWRRRSQYLAHPRHPLRRRAAPCASAPQPAPHSPPFPPPAAAAAAASTHLCSLLFFILWFFLVNTLCIPKNDDYGPAAHPAEAVPRGVDNDGSAKLTQMVLFVVFGLHLLLLHLVIDGALLHPLLQLA